MEEEWIPIIPNGRTTKTKKERKTVVFFSLRISLHC
jgi:hypothetical protein